MGRPKGSKNKPKTDAGSKVEEKPKLQNTSTSTDSSTQPNLAVIDLTSGDILGPDKSIDLNASNTTYYSHSFVQNLCNCTASGYFRKTHAPARKVYALERGSCAHTLIEAWEVEGKDPIEGLPDQWKHYILDNKDKMSPDDQEKIEKGYEETKQMLAEFVFENKDIRDQIRREDVEVPFQIEVTLNVGGDKQIKRTIVGKIDFINWLDRKAGKYTLIDHKTSKTAPGDEELARNTQFALYQMAATKLFGKPPAAMYFYHLAGTHMCDTKFSSKAHPREIGKRVPNCEVNYAIKVPRKTPEQIQNLLDTYYAPAILRWEAQSIGKDGLADPKNRCIRCLTPDTRVLTADMRWIPLGDLRVGDRLFGFSENPVNGASRYSDISLVESLKRSMRDCYRLVTSRGDFTCTGDHFWLTFGHKGHVWKKTVDLTTDDKIISIMECDPWTEDRSYDAGWLAGLIDGEGCLTSSGGTPAKRLTIAQNPGPVFDAMMAGLKERGFNPAVSGYNNGCQTLNAVITKRSEIMRLLGTIRPKRLLLKSDELIVGRAFKAEVNAFAQVFAVEHIGREEIVEIATSTKTFIAETLATHNCEYKEHCDTVTAKDLPVPIFVR